MNNADGNPQWRLKLRRFSILYLKIYALLLVFLVSMSAAYIGIQHARIFPSRDRIVVYGRDSCGITAAFRRELERQKIPYVYADIDKPLIDREMWFKTELPTGKTRITLPMVQIAGKFLESPAASDVIALRANEINKEQQIR